jgi:hypothetical protein
MLSRQRLIRTDRRILIGASAALLLPLAAAHAGDPPKFKEGLWEVHVINEEKPVGKKTDLIYRLCRDHAYDKAADAILKNLPGCTTVIKDVGGGKFSSASNCVVNGTTVVSTAITTFMGTTASHSETSAKFIPPVNGKTDETMTQDQRYIGSCPSDLKPGDTISPDGFIRHHN